MRSIGLAALLFVYFLLVSQWINPLHQPFLNDEASYLFQAHQIAQGDMRPPAPPSPAHVESGFITVRGGRWFSTYLPGWPLLLSAGDLLGAPWLVNPAMLALMCWTAWWMARRIAGVAAGRLCLLILALSPALALQSAFYMCHPASGLFQMLFVMALMTGHPLVAGMVLAWNVWNRPLTAAVLALPFLADRPHGDRTWTRHLALLTLGGVVTCVAFAMLPVVLGGHWALPPKFAEGLREISYDKDPKVAVTGSWKRFVDFGWDTAIPFLLVPALAVFLPGSRSPASVTRRLVLSAIFLQIAYLRKLFDDTTVVGTRYLFESIPALAVVVAVLLARMIAHESSARAAKRELAAGAMIGFLALGTVIGPHLRHEARLIREISCVMVPQVVKARLVDRKAVVFVDEAGTQVYHSAFAHHLSDLRAPIVYFRRLGDAEDDKVRALYPDRDAYVYRCRGVFEPGDLSVLPPRAAP